MKKANAELVFEVKKLEKLKQEYNGVFKKQQQLILVLKKQKVLFNMNHHLIEKLHIQAATMLKFSEQDFVNAMKMDVNWGALEHFSRWKRKWK